MSELNSHAIDAVLPLTFADVPRFRILFRSLVRFYRDRGFLWVVVPDRQLESIRSELAAMCGDALEETDEDVNAASTAKPWIRVCAETTIVPELAAFPLLKGWYRQQLVKLAIAEHVESDFYITLDADVVATRALRSESIIVDGRGLCRVYPLDLHPDWYRRSAAVLGLVPKRVGISHNVTPALLNRHAVRELSEHLSRQAQKRDGSRLSFRALKQRFHDARLRHVGRGDFAAWRLCLAANAPWTEYALYYTYLESTGDFERWHYEATYGLYDRDQSVWRDDAARFDQWDPTPAFEGEGLPTFVVIQSNAGLSPERIWQKLAPFIES